ncbi:MAG TPA: radical SAM protein, partial [Ruminococcaceae bacterium]|nr:radical SAM protein [Oscillospiraceae bacterium]
KSNQAPVKRRITTLEYQSVVEEAIRLGLTAGFMQEKSSAQKEYTPPFDLEGV